MEPHGYHHRLLFISFFCLMIIFNSANATFIPLPRGFTFPFLPHNAPESQSVSSPGSQPVPSPSPTPTSTSAPPPDDVSAPYSPSYPPSNSINPPVSTPASAPVPSSISNPPDETTPPVSIPSSKSDSLSINIGDPTIPLLPPNGDPTIKEICNSTDYPDLCFTTIAPLLVTGGRTDVISVLDMAIKASTDLTKLALFSAKKMSSMPQTTTDMASIFNDCKDSYDDALYNFQNAQDALPARDTGTMNTMLSAVITDVGDCEDQFSGLNSPLADYAGKLTKMTSNCLAIVSLIK